jgi:hypothetical protein
MPRIFAVIIALVLLVPLLIAVAFSAPPAWMLKYGFTPAQVERAVERVFGRIFRWLFAPFPHLAMGSMASFLDTAFQTQYRQEFIAGFEQQQSLLRETVTTEAVFKGNTAVFLVADSGQQEAQTRGVNGLIPARADNNTQNSCVISEWHDLVRKTDFNVFASQGNQRQIMQMTTMGVLNRKIDQQIITELNTGTVTRRRGWHEARRADLHERAGQALERLGAVGRQHHAAVHRELHRVPRADPGVRNAEYVKLRPFAGQEPGVARQADGLQVAQLRSSSSTPMPGKGTSSRRASCTTRARPSATRWTRRPGNPRRLQRGAGL